MKRILLVLAVFGLILGMNGIAMAVTNTSTLTVSAYITDQCQIGNATLAFGVYDPASDTDLAGTATLSVVCTSGTSAKIYSTTAIVSRTIARQTVTGKTTSGSLTYRLFTDAGKTVDLGIIDTENAISYTGTGQTETPTLYASITKSQSQAAGVYYGTANLTISY
jgi:spore coat protein U-like protein